MTPLQAARLLLATPEDRRATDQALLARLLCLDPVMPLTDHQVQACCRLVRQRQGHACDAWMAEVQPVGVTERRAFVRGLLKDAAAGRAGRSLLWSHGPTEGVIHRLKRRKRPADGRAGVDCLRPRMLATSSGEAA